jgi:hypothetical protein
MKLSKKQQQQIFNKAGGRCWYCGVKLNAIDRQSNNGFVIEHSNDRYSYDMDNLLPSCGKCNKGKGKKNIEQFREYKSNRYDLTPNQIEILTRNGAKELCETVREVLKKKYVFYGETYKGDEE